MLLMMIRWNYSHLSSVVLARSAAVLARASGTVRVGSAV